MSAEKLVLVSGATGQQGGAVVDALLAKGHKVRGMSRNVESEKSLALVDRGVEMIHADFTDGNALVSAIKGVDAFFLMGTPFEEGVEKETELGIQAIQAAREARVEHLVYSSVGSANKNTGIPHFESKFKVEQFIQESGLNATIIAPVFFMENVISPWMLPSIKEGFFSQALPEERNLQMISIKNIGAVVAEVISRGAKEYGKRYDLAEDELTGVEVAKILSKVSGKRIGYKGFPPSVIKDQMEDMAIMYEWFDKVGYSVNFNDLKNKFPEVAWTTFKEWAETRSWNILD